MKQNYVFRLLAILITIFLISCSDTKTNTDVIKEPVEVSLNPYVSRLVTVNALAGNDTLKLLFDTGGGETFINPDVAERLGKTPSGRGVGFRMSGEMVESQHCDDVLLTIGSVPFNHESIAVWDINSILPDGLPPLDGILSLKTFQDQPFTLDLSSKLIILESKESLDKRIKAMTKLKSRIATGPSGRELDIFINATIDEHDLWLLLDSGNLDVVLISQHIFNNKLNDSTETTDIWESEIKLKNIPADSARIRSKDIIHEGALSEEFMNNYILTFDLANNNVWISPVKK